MLHNPYLNRSMIRSVDEFYGRRRELNYVMSRIGAPTPQSISVLGERRVGKSSLLWHIAQKEVHSRYLEQPERYVFLMMDFQGKQNLSEEDFCRFFGEELSKGVGPSIEVPQLSNKADIQKVIQRLAQADLRLICLFDEFECITTCAEFSPGFFGFLRSLANLYLVAFVTSSRRDLTSLCHQREIAESPFFNIFSQVHLGPMPGEEIKELIVEPSETAGLPLQPHVENITQLGGHWPFFVQIACATAFDFMMESDSGELDMPRVKQRFQEETWSHFQYFWEHFSDPERAVLASLSREEEPDPAQAAVLEPLEKDGFVQRDGAQVRLFSGVFGRFLRETLAEEIQAIPSGESSVEHKSTSPEERLPLRRIAWLLRLIYAGLGLGLVALLVFLSYAFFTEKAEDQAFNAVLPSLFPETNYPPASGFFRLSDLQVEDIFASFYPRYARQALGRVRITNDDTTQATAILRFYLSDWQRRPTEQRLVLAPQTTQEVELKALLDPAIVRLEDVLPVQAKVVLSVTSGEQVQAIQESQEIRIYGRGALRWDSIARTAAFITSTDRAVASFARPLLVAFEAEAQSLGKPGRNLIQAMVLFEALKQHGVRYIPDSNTPYARSSADKATVDHIQYPAEVLQHKTGDCDDLTTLYCALLENAGVPTALVDSPGHIFMLFDTGVDRWEAHKLPLDASLYLVRGEDLWIPVEITLLSQSFQRAWRAGMDELAELPDRERWRRMVNTERAWKDFSPASPSFKGSVEAPVRAALEGRLLAQYDALKGLIEAHIETTYLDRLEREPHNDALRLQLSQLYCAIQQYDRAINTATDYLVDEVGDEAATYNQLGIARFLKGEINQAALDFKRAVALRPEDEKLQDNLALARQKLGKDEPQGRRQTAGVGDEGTDKSAAKLVDVDDFYWL